MIQNVHLPCLYVNNFVDYLCRNLLIHKDNSVWLDREHASSHWKPFSQGCKQFLSTVFNTLQPQLTASQEIYHEISL